MPKETIDNLIIAASMLVLILFSLRRLLKDRKAGKYTCDGNCGSCEISKTCTKHWKTEKGGK